MGVKYVFKRILSLLLILALIISMVACTGKSETTNINKEDAEQVVNPQSQGEQKTITIAVSKQTYTSKKSRYEIIDYYKRIFEKELGIKVEFDFVESQNYKEFYKGLASKLYTDKAPELILVEYEPYYNLIEQGVAMDVTDKIPNLKKIYNGIIGEKVYKVPIGMIYMVHALNKDVLDGLGVEVPYYDWTAEDYYKIREKWLEQGPVHLTEFQLEDIYYFADKDKVKMFDIENKKVTLNTPEMKDYLRNVRKEVFSGRYIIDKNYTYKNFYNMLYESGSDEYNDFMEISSSYENTNALRLWPAVTPLLVKEMNEKLNIKGINIAYLPFYSNRDNALSTWGLIVNKNGKNVELALQFVNGLLNDDIQMELYNRVYSTYPVNKEIEWQIKDIEGKVNDNGQKIINEDVLRFKDYVLKNIEEGVYKPYEKGGLEYKLKTDFSSMIRKELDAIIFADEEYTEEELTKALKDLENKYNILMNE